jgi:hypothetical protein
MLPGILLTGAGAGLTLPTLVGAAVAAVPSHQFATGTGVITMARQAGIMLGIAVLVTLLGHPASPAGTLAAFRNATTFTGTAAAASGIVSLLIARGRARDRSSVLTDMNDSVPAVAALPAAESGGPGHAPARAGHNGEGQRLPQRGDRED